MARISRLRKTLDKGHAGLILFDALHGYLHPEDPEKRAFLTEHNILLNLQQLLAGARRAGLTTFYPSGSHAPDGSDVVERLTDTDMELRTIGVSPIGRSSISVSVSRSTTSEPSGACDPDG